MNPPGDAQWEPAALPTVRLELRDVSGGRNYQGVCWYRRSFEAKPEWEGRIVYLKFQGAMQVADVWLNGEHLTTHYGGYQPFVLDLSKGLRFGQANVVTVLLHTPIILKFLRASRRTSLFLLTLAAFTAASISRFSIRCTSPIPFLPARWQEAESSSPFPLSMLAS